MPEERWGEGFPEGYRPSEPIPYRPPQWQPGVPPFAGPGGANPPPFPATQPYPPPMSFAPGAPPVRRRSRAGFWILISVLVVLVLASVASFFVIRYINRSTPDKTLDAFCNAVEQADYPSAYEQLSARLQHTISEAAFAAAFAQDRVTACTHGTTGDSGSSVTNNLKLVHASKGINNDIVTLTRDSNDEWKIDDIYRQT
jgi:hypothetical protein